MAKVKFNFNTLDADTNQMYQPSDEFVEVSDAFADRLAKHSANGVNFEVQEDRKVKAPEQEAPKAEYKSKK